MTDSTGPRVVGVDRDLQAIMAIATDWRFDGSRAGRRVAVDERYVLPVQAAGAEKRLQPPVHLLALGHHEQA